MRSFFQNSLLKKSIFVFGILFLFNILFINNIRAQTNNISTNTNSNSSSGENNTPTDIQSQLNVDAYKQLLNSYYYTIDPSNTGGSSFGLDNAAWAGVKNYLKKTSDESIETFNSSYNDKANASLTNSQKYSKALLQVKSFIDNKILDAKKYTASSFTTYLFSFGIQFSPEAGEKIVALLTDLNTTINNQQVQISQNPNDNTNLQNVIDNANKTIKKNNQIGDTVICGDSMFLDLAKLNLSCVVRGMVSGIINFINSYVVVPLRELTSNLLNLAVIAGIYNFSSFVTSDGAIYLIWKVILSLVTSLILPFILYFLIRQLIQNDDSFEKILWPILGTAVFVYFSFPLAAFLIDQSNLISIYIYRSLTGGGSGTMSAAIDNILKLNPNNSGEILYSIFRLITNIVVVFVFFQAAFLMLSRLFILIITLIASPLMAIPETGIKVVDEWRGKIREMFINNLIMAPVFMFMVNIAIQIGTALNTTPIVSSLSEGNLSSYGSLIGPLMISALLIGAIMVAKNLSGAAGAAVLNKVNSWTKRGVKGGAKFVGRNTAGRLAGAAAGGLQKSGLLNNGWINKNSKLGQSIHSGLKSFENKMPRAKEAAEREKRNKEHYENHKVYNPDGTINEEKTKKEKEEYLQRMSKSAYKEDNGWSRQILKDREKGKDQKEVNKILSGDRALQLHRSTLDEDAQKEFDKKILAENITKQRNPNHEDADLKAKRNSYKAAEHKASNGKVLGNFQEAIQRDDALKAAFNKNPEQAEQDWKAKLTQEYKDKENEKDAEKQRQQQTLQAQQANAIATQDLLNHLKNRTP